MSCNLTRAEYEKLVAQNIEWLEKQPQSLERDHIIEIVKDSPRVYYKCQLKYEGEIGDKASVVARALGPNILEP